MGLPSNMDDEMLQAFGFKVSPDNRKRTVKYAS